MIYPTPAHKPSGNGGARTVKTLKRLWALKRTWILLSLLLIGMAFRLNVRVLMPASESSLYGEPPAFMGFSLDWPSVLAFAGLACLVKFLGMCYNAANK